MRGLRVRLPSSYKMAAFLLPFRWGMDMSRRMILVLSDDVHLTEGIPAYARALAERSDADIHYLLLLRPEPYFQEMSGDVASVAANLDELTKLQDSILERIPYYIDAVNAR